MVGYEAGYFNDVAKRSSVGLQDMLEFLDDGLGLGNLLSQDASAADRPQHDRGGQSKALGHPSGGRQAGHGHELVVNYALESVQHQQGIVLHADWETSFWPSV